MIGYNGKNRSLVASALVVTLMKWMLSRQNALLLFEAFQGVGTIAIAVIAIWSIFFTNLPEVLIRQLRTDIADTKERLIDLQRERRDFSAANRRIKLEVRSLEKQKRDTQTELDSLTQELARLRKETLKAQLDRKSYLKNSLRLDLALFIKSMTDVLFKGRQRAELLATYHSAKEWLAREPKIRRKASVEEVSQYFKERARWNDEAPNLWRDEYLLGELTRKTWVGEDVVDKLKNEILSVGAPLTGLTLVRSMIAGRHFTRLLPDEKSSAISALNDYVARNRAMLARPLEPFIREPWTKDSVRTHSSRILRNQQAFRNSLSELRKLVEARVR